MYHTNSRLREVHLSIGLPWKHIIVTSNLGGNMKLFLTDDHRKPLQRPLELIDTLTNKHGAIVTSFNPRAQNKEEWFEKNLFSDNDVLLFLDAWNPTALEMKALSARYSVKLKFAGIWWGGSYDCNSLLGKTSHDSSWAKLTERALFNTYDMNLFATKSHAKLVADKLLELRPMFGIKPVDWLLEHNKHAKIVGMPFDHIHPEDNVSKEDVIALDLSGDEGTQPDVLAKIQEKLPDFTFVDSNDFSSLASAKVVFSANTKEGLDVNVYAGMVNKALPLVPDRLSYQEMYPDQYRYKQEWTEDSEFFDRYCNNVIDAIRDYVVHYDRHIHGLSRISEIRDTFFSSDAMCQSLVELSTPEDTETSKRKVTVSFGNKA